jgi:dienelactone hydrolase
VFYPAADADTDGFDLETYARNPYLPERLAIEWGADRSRALGLRDDAVNWQFRTRAHEFAPVLPGTYPVILFSPPLRSPRWSYTSMAEELASHGYVVIAVDHTYESPLVQFPGRQIEASSVGDIRPSGAVLERVGNTRADDLAFVVGHVDQLGSDLEAISDVSRVGLYGYTGVGTDHFTRLAGIREIGAIAALPQEIEPEGRPRGHGSSDTPLMFVGGDQVGSAPWRNEWERLCGWKARVRIAGASPQAFTDAAAYLPALATEHRALASTVDRTLGSAEASTVTDTARRYLVAFFDLHLKEQPSTVLTVRDPPTPDGITVSIVRRGDCQ